MMHKELLSLSLSAFYVILARKWHCLPAPQRERNCHFRYCQLPVSPGSRANVFLRHSTSHQVSSMNGWVSESTSLFRQIDVSKCLYVLRMNNVCVCVLITIHSPGDGRFLRRVDEHRSTRFLHDIVKKKAREKKRKARRWNRRSSETNSSVTNALISLSEHVTSIVSWVVVKLFGSDLCVMLELLWGVISISPSCLTPSHTEWERERGPKWKMKISLILASHW